MQGFYVKLGYPKAISDSARWQKTHDEILLEAPLGPWSGRGKRTAASCDTRSSDQEDHARLGIHLLAMSLVSDRLRRLAPSCWLA